MLDFSLSEELLAIQKMARDFAKRGIKPVVHLLDDDDEGGYADQIIARAARAGILGMIIPQRYGGSGKTAVECSVVLEEIAAACGGIATAIGANWLAQTPILLAATPEQREKFLPPLAGHEPRLACLAMTEPTGGSDIENPHMQSRGIYTTATPRDGGYVLNGTKRFPSNAGIAHLSVVVATVNRELGDAGSCIFVVPDGTPGLSFGKPEDKMGMRADRNADVIFDDCWVPADHLLSQVGDGARLLQLALAYNRAGAGAIAVGMARGSLEIALDWAKVRVQGGKLLFEQQLISAMLADMATEIDAARLLVQRAVWYNATHRPPSLRYASMAKVFASDMAMRVTEKAIQIMGSYGYMKEYGVEKYMRDAKIVQIYLGPNEISRLAIGESL